MTTAAVVFDEEKFEWALQKGTESEVAAFVPVWTERSVVPLRAAAAKAVRWADLLREAARSSPTGAASRSWGTQIA